MPRTGKTYTNQIFLCDNDAYARRVTFIKHAQEQGDVIVVDRSEVPNDGDLVILTDKTFFKLREYKGQNNLWGKVSWVISKR